MSLGVGLAAFGDAESNDWRTVFLSIAAQASSSRVIGYTSDNRVG